MIEEERDIFTPHVRIHTRTPKKESILSIARIMAVVHDAPDPAINGSPSRPPLQPTGILDGIHHVDLTPVIGREFPTARLADWIHAPNADELLKELAYISQLRWSDCNHHSTCIIR